MKKIVSLPMVITIMLVMNACDDFVKIDPPRTALIKATVFENDATANAAMVEVYRQLRSGAFAAGSIFSVSLLMSLAADEQINYATGTAASVEQYRQISSNDILPVNTTIAQVWNDLYLCIYKCNAILEGLSATTRVSNVAKQQLTGEAKFIRAFCNFYLVNIWGDVPLVLSTDYRTNATIGRTDKSLVYQKIIMDLQDAQTLLPDSYAFANNERVRANRWVATALLARTYLYTKQYEDAEIQASHVIANTALYTLRQQLSEVFNKNNTESLLQWWSTIVPNELSVFYFQATPRYGALRQSLVAEFNENDLRKLHWVRQATGGLYATTKYAKLSTGEPEEYSTVMRLAEQYLIRAEARAHLDKITDAQNDINVIRTRAGLADTTAADKDAILAIIENERRLELFNEWGHRWFDLKRTGRIDNVLSPLKPMWVATASLWPLPEGELLKNPTLSNQQNPGY